MIGMHSGPGADGVNMRVRRSASGEMFTKNKINNNYRNSKKRNSETPRTDTKSRSPVKEKGPSVLNCASATRGELNPPTLLSGIDDAARAWVTAAWATPLASPGPSMNLNPSYTIVFIPSRTARWARPTHSHPQAPTKRVPRVFAFARYFVDLLILV